MPMPGSSAMGQRGQSPSRGLRALDAGARAVLPVDAYLIDLCLIDPQLPAGVLAEPLNAGAGHVPRARPGDREPGVPTRGVAALRQAIAEGWADVAGGRMPRGTTRCCRSSRSSGSSPTAARSIARTSTTATSRPSPGAGSGCTRNCPRLPSVSVSGIRMHLGFDAGRFPVRAESKRLWESPDGSNLESLTRPPLAADRASQGWLLPGGWRPR